jgi:hypothetical protein
MPTGRAGAAGISGIYQVDGNTRLCRLVGDVFAQLEERPGMPLIAMFVSNRCSLLREVPVSAQVGYGLLRLGSLDNHVWFNRN